MTFPDFGTMKYPLFPFEEGHDIEEALKFPSSLKFLSVTVYSVPTGHKGICHGLSPQAANTLVQGKQT